MKRLLLVMCILLSISSTVRASEWTSKDTALQVVYTSLQVIDWEQTHKISRHPEKYSEINPILGKHPSGNKVDVFMGGSLVIHMFISILLPKKYRSIWQCSTIAIKGGMIGYNFSIGL